MKLKTRLKNNKSGFTLLEIIIVIIIVGVLASLALPRFFQTINLARGTEALNAMATAKRGIDRCALTAGAAAGAADYSNCDNWDAVGLDDPGIVPGASFTYAWTAFAAPDVVLTATGNGPPDGTIIMTYDTSTGLITRAGTLDFSSIQ